MTMIGAKRLDRQLAAIPREIRLKVRGALAKGAEEVVAMQRRLAPDWLADKIGWSFGDAPRGALVLGSFGEGGADLRVTIFVRDYRAAWFEFGTGERYRNTRARARAAGKAPGYSGRITAQPYFYPGYRMMRARVKNRISRVMKKAIRDAVRGS